MDQQTRNEFERYCALAEIEEDAERFADIRNNVTRILEEKQSRLNRLKSTRGVRIPLPRSDVA